MRAAGILLPLSSLQKIHKAAGIGPHGPNAVGPRQAREGQQDPCGSHPFTAPATTPSMMYFWQAR